MVPPTHDDMHMHMYITHIHLACYISKDQRCEDMMTFIKILHTRIFVCVCNACDSHPVYVTNS